MSMSQAGRSKTNEGLSALVGKTISSVRVEGHHGDVFRLVCSDGTDLTLCTYHGTSQENIRAKDDVYVAVNGKEIS
jgi:hypothetical protein